MLPLCLEVFFITAEQYLLTKAFSTSQTVLPVRQLGVHKKLGGDTAGTAESKGSKRNSTIYGVMLSIFSCEKNNTCGTLSVMTFAFPSHHYM